MTKAEDSARVAVPFFVILAMSLFRHSSFVVRHF